MKILEWHGSTSESMVSMVIHEARKTDAVMIEFYTLDDSGLDRFGFFKDSNLSEKIPNMFNPVNKSNTAKFSSNIVFNNNLPGFTFGVSDLDRNKSGF